MGENCNVEKKLYSQLNVLISPLSMSHHSIFLKLHNRGPTSLYIIGSFTSHTYPVMTAEQT